MRFTQPQLRYMRLFGLMVFAAWVVFVSSPSTLVATAWTRPGAARAAVLQPDSAQRARVAQSYGKLPFSFEANLGQADDKVKFLSRGDGYTLFLTSDEAVLALRKTEGSTQKALSKQKAAGRNGNVARSNAPEPPAVVRMKLVELNPAAKIAGLEELPGKRNYFIGNDPKKWRTDVPNYAKVQYQGVYPGVDLVYYGSQGQLEYDFVVAPGADPHTITLEIETGASKLEIRRWSTKNRNRKPEIGGPLRIDANGDLVVHFSGEEMRFHKPVIYQPTSDSGFRTPDKEFIDGRYVLKGRNRIGFAIASYDRTRSLVIDPVLAYSSYLGGSREEQVFAIAVDGSGNAYVTGFTYSTDFPRVNQIPGTCNGGCGSGAREDTFVTKINAAGDALVYSTYIGGSGSEYGNGIAVDGSGNVYLVGDSTSTDFPLVNQIPGVCRGSCGRGTNYDVFVMKINAAGDALVYSSYIGGSSLDEGYGIAADGSGNAILTGFTLSADFPRVNQIAGACNGSCGTGSNLDIFVTKVNPAGTALIYCSLVGGSGEDRALGIAVDGSGDAYLTGKIRSTDFPKVNQIPGACLGACGSGVDFDAFVTKVDAAGSALVFSSYLGGSAEDLGYIAVDDSGNAYVTGYTESADFPKVNQIPGACRGTCGSGIEGQSDAFVTKINAAGDALVYSSYLGGSGNEEGFGIAIDGSGSACLEGFTRSADFPRVNQIPGACLGTCGTGANVDAFVTKINAAGDALVYSSYLGGSGDDNNGFLAGIALDSSGSVYIGGETRSTDFPRVNQIAGACVGACGTGLSGGDAYVTKISPTAAVSLSPTSLDFGPQGLDRPSTPQIATLTNTGDGPLSIDSITIKGPNRGDFSEADNCPKDSDTLAPGDYCTITVVFAPTGTGTRTAAVTITDNAPDSPQMVPLTGIGVAPFP